jgi:hypothetical protein
VLTSPPHPQPASDLSFRRTSPSSPARSMPPSPSS